MVLVYHGSFSVWVKVSAVIKMLIPSLPQSSIKKSIINHKSVIINHL